MSFGFGGAGYTQNVTNGAIGVIQLLLHGTRAPQEGQLNLGPSKALTQLQAKLPSLLTAALTQPCCKQAPAPGSSFT